MSSKVCGSRVTSPRTTGFSRFLALPQGRIEPKPRRGVRARRMNSPARSTHRKTWRCLSGWVLIVMVWLFSRSVIWPRLERDWLMTGFTRYNGLAGNAPISCPPPRAVALVRLAMHPMTGALLGATGLVLFVRSFRANGGRGVVRPPAGEDTFNAAMGPEFKTSRGERG